MPAKRKHNPSDTYNCLCDECVYQSLRRMGGPWKTVKQTKADFMRAHTKGQSNA